VRSGHRRGHRRRHRVIDQPGTRDRHEPLGRH
jgi:hypothetical protein